MAREAILVQPPPPLPCLTKILAEKNPLSECLLRGNSSLQVLNYSNFITILVRIQHLLHEFKSCSNLFHFKEKNWFVVFFSQNFLFSFLGPKIFWQLWAWEYKYLIFYQHQISPSTSLKFFDIWTWVIFCPPKSNSILNNEQIHSRASAHLMCCPRGYVGIRTAGNSAESVSRFGETWFCQIWQRWSAY